MKNKQPPKEAKYFKYQFTKLMVLLAILVLLFCGVGIGISVYRIYRFGVHGFIGFLQSPFLILICLFAIALVCAVLVKSQYVVTDTHYITQFGFIKSKYLIKDVTALVLDSDTKKLTVYVGEEYSVLSMTPQWQDEFIAALRKINPNIDFSFTLATKSDEEK